jgi:hypothetical protein
VSSRDDAFALHGRPQRLRAAIAALENVGRDPAQLGLREEADALAAAKVSVPIKCLAHQGP